MILLRMNYGANRYGNGWLRRLRGHGEPITLITRDVVIAATSHLARPREIRRPFSLYPPPSPSESEITMTFADRLSRRELMLPERRTVEV